MRHVGHDSDHTSCLDIQAAQLLLSSAYQMSRPYKPKTRAEQKHIIFIIIILHSRQPSWAREVPKQPNAREDVL